MILWMRHGESTWNAAGRLQGHTAHPPLTDRGRAQVYAAVEEIRDDKPTRVLTSPAVRARQSAQIVADALDLPLTVDDRLIELGLQEDAALALQRIHALVEEIDPLETVLVVSHGDIIPMAYRLVTGQSLGQALPNAGLVRTP